MEIKEIKIGDLISFVNSEEFERLNPKPITDLRAISQFHNPDADLQNTALIYVTKDDELLGFAGLLPRKINNSNFTVFSNTCWWAHPEKGRGLAIPLILKVIEKSNSALYLSENTPELKTILEKTGQFEFDEPIHGIRGFFRFYFADIFTKRHQNNSAFLFLFKISDVLLNFISSPFRFYFLEKYKKERLEITPVKKIDKDLSEFINKHGSSDFIQNTSENFEWFQKYHWVKKSQNRPSYNYPFSHYVNNYVLNYFKLCKNEKIIGFVAISNRDNLAKIPYIYFKKENIQEVVNSIMSILLKKKYDSLIVFQPDIVKYLNSQKMPFLFKRKQIKFVGTTKLVYKYFKEKSYIQDGDGDGIFT